MSVRKRRLRTRSGAAIVGLVISLLFMILFMGLFAFDANRAQLCQRELIAACDSASITGTAMLASYDTSPNGQTSLAIAQQLAAGYAFNMFTKAVVLGQNLSGAQLKNLVTDLYNVTSARQCNVIIALGDPNNNFQAIAAAGDPNGRTVEIFACYGYQPDFLSALPLGIKVTPIAASSFGGLPQVDAVVVFDYSGSMDDFTSVLFVRREWWWPSATSSLTGTAGKGNGLPLYSVVTGLHPGSNNLFSNYLKWSYSSQPAGSGTNVLPPQNLQGVGSGNPAAGNPLTYTNALRANPLFCAQWLGSACMAHGGNSDHTHYSPYVSPGGTLLTLNSNDYGQPPGNYKPVFVNLQDGLGGVTSLPPDAALSDTNITNSNPALAGWGQPSFWWWHRGTTSPTNLGSGLLHSPPCPAGSTYPAAQAGSIMVSSTAAPYEPNAWASSLVTSTTNYGFGYPPQFGTTLYNASAANLAADNTYFTDLVVNLTDPTGGGGSYQTQPIPAITASTISNFFFTPFQMTFPADEGDSRLATHTFNFADLATLVEAARGNLDLNANYVGACLDGQVIIRQETSPAGAATPLAINPPTTSIPSSQVNPHFQLAYERCAMLESQPYATAADGAENGFFYKLSTLADCRYGFVGFSAVKQNGNDNYGASFQNCLKPYPQMNLSSQGTATANSHLRSGLQYYYNAQTYYYGAGGGAPANPNIAGSLPGSSPGNTSANLGWWRSGQNAAPGSFLPQAVTPTISEQVYGFKPPATVANEGGNAVGFKLPRTQLCASSTNTFNQLSMVTSHETGGAAPYNTAPYGDVWSSTASNGNANGVWNGRPMTDTYCDEALNTAYQYFNPLGTNNNIYYTASSRLAARKAIVFFTDGEPTGGLTGTGNAAAQSKAVANNCQAHQISLFTIGLNMDPTNNGQLTTDQYQFLGDGVNASYAGSQQGLAWSAGNGSRFFQCQNGSSVRSAFASIARRLSQAQF